MAIFNNFFGKDALNQLKSQLMEREAEARALQIENSQLKDRIQGQEDELQIFQSGLSQAKELLATKDAEVVKLNTQIEDLNNYLAQQSLENKSQQVSFESEINKIRAQLDVARSECDSHVRRANELKNTYDRKDHEFSERERKLAQKSDELIQERQKLKEQTSENSKLVASIRAKEKNWIENIEPKLAQYQSHLSLDQRKSELDAQKAELDRYLASLLELDTALHERSQKFDVEFQQLSQELSHRESKLEKFRARVDQLDIESNSLSKQRLALAAKTQAQIDAHSKRMAVLRSERSALRQEVKALKNRETDIKTREKELKIDQKEVISVRAKNIDLSSELKSLRLELRECNKTIHELRSGNVNGSLMHPNVLNWLVQNASPKKSKIKNGWLGSVGQGPWGDHEFRAALEEIGFEFYPLGDSDLEYIVVGREDFEPEKLIDHIDARAGQTLRIYSQEMFIAKLICDSDPFDSDDMDLLYAFAEGHPALQYLMGLDAPWPEVVSEDTGNIMVVGPEDFGVDESPLHIMGYHVGATSDLSAAQRRKILSQFFSAKQLEYSPKSDERYKLKWGRPLTAQRLYRMAEHIRYLARRGDERMIYAKQDWISDLKWLKDNYYAKYRRLFAWPGK